VPSRNLAFLIRFGAQGMMQRFLWVKLAMKLQLGVDEELHWIPKFANGSDYKQIDVLLYFMN